MHRYDCKTNHAILAEHHGHVNKNKTEKRTQTVIPRDYQTI